MRINKKWIILIFCITLTLTMAGCSKGNAPVDSTSTSTASSSSSTVAASSSEIVGKEKHVTVLFTKPGNLPTPPEDNIVKENIEKLSGITFNQISPPVANYNEKVNMIMTSNDLPDIVSFGSSFTEFLTYANQGAFMPLDDLLTEELAPDILRVIPEKYLEMCRVDGKLYGLPNYTSPKRYNYFLRGDWLDSLGLAEPTTLDELYSVLYAFTYNDPDRNGKDDTFGLGGIGCKSSTSFEAFDVIWGAYGVIPQYWYEDASGKYMPYNITREMRDALEYIAKLYKDGLIDPEWVTTTADAQLVEKFAKNQVGSATKWWIFEPQVEKTMQQTDPNVELRRIAPPAGSSGKGALRGAPSMKTAIGITTAAKDPKTCIEFMNWYHTDEGMLSVYVGVEDVHWKYTDDGKVITLDAWNDVSKWVQFYSLFESEEPLFLVDTYLLQSRIDSQKWDVVVNAIDGKRVEAETEYGADLKTLTDEVFTDIIIGKSNISAFDKYVNDWLSNGGQKWIDQINN